MNGGMRNVHLDEEVPNSSKIETFSPSTLFSNLRHQLKALKRKLFHVDLDLFAVLHDDYGRILIRNYNVCS